MRSLPTTTLTITSLLAIFVPLYLKSSQILMKSAANVSLVLQRAVYTTNPTISVVFSSIVRKFSSMTRTAYADCLIFFTRAGISQLICVFRNKCKLCCSNHPKVGENLNRCWRVSLNITHMRQKLKKNEKPILSISILNIRKEKRLFRLTL
jgi:hypothetical protein